MFNKYKLERLNAFSDGVIAVAITLLVLTIDVPHDHDFSSDGLFSFLLKAEYELTIYAISFVLIGTFWVNHYIVFHYLQRSTPTLVWMNLIFLLGVTLLPLATQLMGNYRFEPLVVVIYGSISILVSLTLALTWWYASRVGGLTIDGLAPATVKRILTKIVLGSVLSLAAIGMAWVNIRVAHLLFLATPLVSLTTWTSDPSDSIGEGKND